MCDTQCIQPVHPAQDIQKELEIVISFCMFPMFVKETVEYICSVAQLCSIQHSPHIILFLFWHYSFKKMEVCDELFLPKIKGFPSLRFYCWTRKEQRAWSVKPEREKGNISLLTHSVSEKRLTVTKLMLGATSSVSSSSGGGGGRCSK